MKTEYMVMDRITRDTLDLKVSVYNFQTVTDIKYLVINMNIKSNMHK